MGWATQHIIKLTAGETVKFRPQGNSMVPRIHSGQLCTLVPARIGEIAVDDIVLCKVKGAEYLHLVKAIIGERYQIGNNKGRINGWVGSRNIYGRLVSVDP